MLIIYLSVIQSLPIQELEKFFNFKLNHLLNKANKDPNYDKNP
jgi:hypothetical protein